MKSVFKKLSSPNEAGGQFTSPAKEFDTATQALKASDDIYGPMELPDDASRLRPIATLVRNLVQADYTQG